MRHFGATAYIKVIEEEGLEKGQHYKIIGIQSTGSKRPIKLILFEEVNTGGRPSK